MQNEVEKLPYLIFDAINAPDWDTVCSLVTDDMTQQVLPRSLGHPAQSLEEWIGTFSRAHELIPDFKATVDQVLSASENAVCFHVCSVSQSAQIRVID
jgi:ketosteroid isomerase-like protein